MARSKGTVPRFYCHNCDMVLFVRECPKCRKLADPDGEEDVF